MIQFKLNHPDATMPTRGSDNSMGWDLYAVRDGVIYQGCQELVNTGIQWGCPQAWGGIIMPRSGLACKQEIDRRAGAIDGDYRGDIKILLRNEGDEAFIYKKGDRVAQLVVIPYMSEAVLVDEISDTARGAGGFGHTGR